MSDCSTQAMMPKQPRILCTCCLETAKAKDIEQRYERLAHVAREMLDEYRLLYAKHATIAGKVGTFARFEAPGVFAGQLEALGVSVDD